jgi:arginyl-tRNA synthetase
MTDLEEVLRRRLAPAFEALAGEPVDPTVRRSQHADFQSDAALALSRRLGENPRAIAAKVVEAAHLDEVCAKVEISGPGFINLTVSGACSAECWRSSAPTSAWAWRRARPRRS